MGAPIRHKVRDLAWQGGCDSLAPEFQSPHVSVQTAVLSLRVRTRLQSCALGALSEQQSASAPAPRTGA